MSFVPVNGVADGRGGPAGAGAGTILVELMPKHDDFLMLERDLLDQQIIDVHGHKVVRVNDVDLVWECGTSGDRARR